MNRREWIAQARARLERSGSPDPREDAIWLLCGALDLPRGGLTLWMDREIPEDRLKAAEAQLCRREGGEPLQYVQGVACFMGLDFSVDRRVLIPRQDTETLCEAALARLQPGMRALDLCTGSGALAVALARLGKADVTGADISADALDVARENARRNGVNVRWRQGDLYGAVPGERFDLMVCNPPYLTETDMQNLQAEVAFEPALALYGGTDGLDFYRRLVCGLSQHLEPGGCALFEVGAGQAQAVRALLEAALTGRTGVINDLCGVERVVYYRRSVE